MELPIWCKFSNYPIARLSECCYTLMTQSHFCRILLDITARVVAVFVMGCLAASSGSAQSTPVPFQRLSVNDGLSHNNVIDIHQDRFGYLWFGTESGLNRYDGYEVVVYKHHVGDPRSLSDNWVYDIYEDRQGDLWIATEAGLNRYDRDGDAFERHLVGADFPGGGRADVFSIAEDEAGRLVMGTYNGMVRYDVARNLVDVFNKNVEQPGSLHADTVYAVLEDSGGTIWLGTWRGLARFDEATDTFIQYRHSAIDPYSLSSDNVRAIYRDRSGALWIGTGNGLNRFDERQETFIRFLAEPGVDGALQTDAIWDIYEDRKGQLWISTVGSGLYRYEEETGSFWQVLSSARARGANANRLQAVLEDHSGVLWVGSAGSGVYFQDRVSGYFGLIARDPDAPGGLSSNEVFGIEEDWSDPDILWIGTRGGGLNRLDRSTGRLTVFRHDPGNERSLSHDVVEAILVDRAGAVWVGTWGGLDRYDRDTQSFTRISFDEERELDRWKRIVYEAPSTPGVLWIASGARGLVRYDVQTGDFTVFSHDPSDVYTLGGNWVASLYEDRRGRLWVGTEGGELNLFDPVSASFRRFAFDPDTPNSLKSQDVYAINETPDGMLWLGTENGLVRFDSDRGQFRHFTEDNSDVSSNMVYGIEVDDEGMLWVSTLGGLNRFDPVSASFRNYDLDRGLQARAFHPFAAHRGASGRIYFGGPGGLNVFHPEEINENPHPPRIVLDDLKLFNQSVVPGETSPLLHSMLTTNHIALAPDENDISLGYLGLHFSNPGNIKYAYKLDPYDSDWREVGATRTATYTSLGPATYTFSVRAVSPDGVVSESEPVSIHIRTPWWRRPWAMGLYVLMLGAGMYGVHTFQSRRLVRREQIRARIDQAELRAEAAELARQAVEMESRALRAENARHESELQKAQELKEAYDALERSMQELRKTQEQLIQSEKMASLGMLMGSIAHELKNPLNFVTNFASVVNESLDELRELARTKLSPSDRGDAEDLEELLEVISINTSKIEKHGYRADQIVSSMMKHVSGIQGQHVPTRLDALLDESIDQAYARFRERDDAVAVIFRRDYHHALEEISLIPQDMKQVFVNILDNSFDAMSERATSKRMGDTYSPELTVETVRTEKGVEVRFADNGIGIRKEHLHQVFDPFFTTKPAGKGSAGLGLSLCYNIVVTGHQGRMAVESDMGKGATFVVELPI